MFRKYIAKTALLTVVMSLVVLTACTRAVGAPVVSADAIAPTWITATKNGDSAAVPIADVQKNTIVHFFLEGTSGKMAFMSYIFEGKTYVRANICPPCRSINFTLDKDILVCDSCFTRFEAGTGNGVSGACVNYPKASVDFVLNGDSIVMKTADMETAYRNTLKPGLP